MLIRITNKCFMNCSHCMMESHPEGEHMSMDIYKQAIEFSASIEPFLLFLSGGEPTEHPDFIEYVNMAKSYVTGKKVYGVVVASNGMFLENESYTKKILDLGVTIQITNDDRYYPKRIPVIDHPLLSYENRIRVVSPFGKSKNVKSSTAPYCFNLRSTTSYYEDAIKGISELRLRLKMCTPSINVDGSVVAGEASSCGQIGTVFSSKDELTKGILGLKCSCKLSENLKGMSLQKWKEFNKE